ncbi:UDP-N-acetylmuramoyl-tripeptide--D-alanyl-D-alanine ligase [Streptococcaceae bacterium ESL0687]|nr:UDP-N-acetylmuramoyl-tripeptide--D-alanyl-D-alanine ligase [Streptococcaceae bacterium ESL0687]
MKLSLYEVAKVVGAKNKIEEFSDLELTGTEFDSRKIKAGDLFLPLKGERDGHDFISKAFENGAVASLSEKDVEGHPYLLVDDVLKAFQDLARYVLDKTGVDVIAVTGSNGKTTTKDMIASVLETTYKTYKTQGNYNNEIGLPYTVLHMPQGTEKLVLEMGQDHLGDIHSLSEIARPKISVITMIGESHIEFFGSREKIAEGKMQIVDGMKAGTLIAPADKIINQYLPENQKIVRFGPNEDIYISNLYSHADYQTFDLNFMDRELTVPLPGKFNATNAMLAAYVGKLEGVTEENIKRGLQEDLKVTGNRTEWLKAANGADILSDVYNANPTAMRLMLETFQELENNPGGKKAVVLADMKELGENSKMYHSMMITAIDPEKIDRLYLYGEEMEALVEYAKDIFEKGHLKFYRKDLDKDELDDLIKDVAEDLGENDQILLKGSNSMKLSEVVKGLLPQD